MTTRKNRQKLAGAAKNSPQIRKMLGERFRLARRNCWLSVAEAAQMLQVSQRTVHNWESGATRPPFAAYKLMRLQASGDLGLLSGKWEGWLIHRGKLVSPEGREFTPSDSSWWSLLVQRARAFSTVSRASMRQGEASGEAETAAPAAGAATPGAVAGRSPAGERSESPRLGLVSIETKVDNKGARTGETAQPCGFVGLYTGHAVGPQWGHNGATFHEVKHEQSGQVQPTAAARPAPAGSGNGASYGHQPERLHGAGTAQLDAVPSPATGSGASHGQDEAASFAGDEAASFATVQAGDMGQGRQERALPLRIGPQVQAVPRRADVGGAP